MSREDITTSADSAADDVVEEFEIERLKRGRRDDGDVQKTRMQ